MRKYRRSGNRGRKHSPSGKRWPSAKTRRDYVPLPLFRQGPYSIEITKDRLRLTPRPGTRAHKCWQREKEILKDVNETSRDLLILGGVYLTLFLVILLGK